MPHIRRAAVFVVPMLLLSFPLSAQPKPEGELETSDDATSASQDESSETPEPASTPVDNVVIGSPVLPDADPGQTPPPGAGPAGGKPEIIRQGRS